MKLHSNPKLYKQAVRFTSEKIGLPEIYIEKDYWLCLVLKAIYSEDIGNQVVFKGGTSLSKCFGIIERFSEDIDLSLLKSPNDSSNQLTKKLKAISTIVSIIIPEVQVEGLTRKMGMNRKTVHSYAKEFQGEYGHVRDALVVEAAWLGNPEPYQEVSINSFIGTMMEESNQLDLIEEYDMGSFQVKAQDPRKTICEKIMSLVRFSNSENPIQDLKKKIRHVYDLHLLIENPQCKEFITSEEFTLMLHEVAFDDIVSYRNDNKWLSIHPKEALIFNHLTEIWKELKDEYEGDFSNLVYGTLPEPEHVLKSIKVIKAQIETMKWQLEIEEPTQEQTIKSRSRRL
jgi:hypothetical protein